MDARELRIGNYVTDEFYESFKNVNIVSSINEYGVNLFIEDDGNYPECAKTWIEPEYRNDVIFGIPLTEEWLLKFGFLSNPYDDIYELDGFYLDAICIDLNLGVQYYYNGLEIKYVHQLQNLYFALTGTELYVD